MDELQAARRSVEQALDAVEELTRAFYGQADPLEMTRHLADANSHLHHALVRLPEPSRDQIIWHEQLHEEMLKV